MPRNTTAARTAPVPMYRRGAMVLPHWSDGGDACATVVSNRNEGATARMKPARDTTARWSFAVRNEGATAGSGSWLTVRRLSSGFRGVSVILSRADAARYAQLLQH